MNNKLDILCFGAHPDDVELAMGGTVIKHVQMGQKIGLVDLTKGEMGTRGDEHTRREEAAKAAEIMGIHHRENLELPDGFIETTKESLIKVVESIRACQPEIVFCNAPSDRHPDHGAGSALVERACFLSGLIKLKTSREGVNQEAYRPKRVFQYIQDRYLEPSFVVDVTEQFNAKMEAVMAYTTQFYNPEDTTPNTPISTPEFLDYLKGRAVEFGRRINTKYGEGFISVNPIKVQDLSQLI